MKRFLAIDPGDVHVGLAEFAPNDRGWECVWAGEMTPDDFLPWFVRGLRQRAWDHVVLESWKLFPESAPVYVGSDMPTSRLIGSIQALVAFVPEDDGWMTERPPIFMQDPQIKVPTRGVLKRRKLRSTAKRLRVTGDHASDAELHGYHWLLRHDTPIRQSGVDLTARHDLW